MRNIVLITIGIIVLIIASTSMFADTLITNTNITVNDLFATGEVGVGTSNPDASLEISRNTDLLNHIILNQTEISVQAYAITITDDNLFRIRDVTASGSPTRIVIRNSSGNIGIGTTTPVSKLHVTSSAGWGSESNAGVTIGAASGGQLRLGYDTSTGYGWVDSVLTGGGAKPLSLNPTGGDVGFGVVSPQRKAHINDTMRLEPRSSAPTSPSLGDIYVDSDSNELCFYDGGSWTGLKSGGICA